MPFDNYNTAAGYRNMGASFTVARKSGGNAYLGNTRDGLIEWSYLLNEHFGKWVTNGYNNLGVAEANSKEPSDEFFCSLSHNLAGDPETPMWTAIPKVNSSVVVAPYGSNGVSIYGVVTGSKICVMSALDNGKSFFDTITTGGVTYVNVPKPYYVTITKNNYIPYLKNPTTVYIQDTVLRNDGYLNCQTVSAGFNVTSTMPTGNVVVQSGASVTFETTGDILLDKGFEVQLGAGFEAKTK
jgi:hypothetical protein